MSSESTAQPETKTEAEVPLTQAEKDELNDGFKSNPKALKMMGGLQRKKKKQAEQKTEAPAQAGQTQEPKSAPAESNTEKEKADAAEKEKAETAEKDAIHAVVDKIPEPCASSPNQEVTLLEQTPAKENGPSSALVAAIATTPTHNRQLTTMNEKDLACNSPRAKIRTYAATDHQFGLASPRKNQNRKPKICLDHFCVDVPSEEQLQELFKVFDLNSDGRVSLVEFRGVFQDSFENYGAPMEDRDVDRLFAKFDTGAGRRGQARDGFLSYDEFCILVLNRLRQ